MTNREVLKKVQSKKALIGEMESKMISKCNWISVILTGIVAIAFIIVEASFGRKATCFLIGSIYFTWASAFYYCQYFLAKRPIGILLGGIGETVGALIMILNYVLTLCGVI